MNKPHMMIGKTITAILIAEDKEAIRFEVKDGEPVVAKCDADCCSHTWIESVELPALGLPATVTAVEDLNLRDDTEQDDEVIRYYGCKISTDRGELVIDYRNSSNGYYGGDLKWPDDSYFYGGVYGQNVSDEKWQPLAATT